jgi:DNA topoisomerase-1
MAKTKKKTRTKRYPKNLVIVESPAKSKTIEKYLGKDFKVLSSMGHLRDLPKSKLAIDIEKNFEPSYIIIRGKSKVLKDLKEYAQNAEMVYLAPDPDREGEAIAWHLTHALELSENKYQRIEFNEITKKAVLNSFNEARMIDIKRVNAQQARRLLDRLVGYKISPIFWKKIRRGLSAGRVQSVAVRIICDREAEIEAFKPEEYWSVDALFSTAKNEKFTAQVVNKKEKISDFTIHNEQETKEIIKEITGEQSVVENVIKKEKMRNPVPPFITSTLQQEASRRLGYSTVKTMMIAQQLYEGIDIGEETPVGLITYMRTDSTRTSNDALEELKKFVIGNFGAEYSPEIFNTYKQNKSAQDAHEAIRPTSILREPKILEQYLSPEQLKLYKLIWRRFVASQMKPAIYDQTSIEIGAASYLLRASGSIIKFSGFLKVYEEQEENTEQTENELKILPEVSIGDKLTIEQTTPLQHFTQPPARYTEASLIKMLEEKGIGRPSTYSPIISTIVARNYVRKEGKALIPTDLGRMVDNEMRKHFPDIVDIGFTVEMENKLDEIAEGNQDWRKMLADFYGPFSKEVTAAEKNMQDLKQPDQEAGFNCEKCGKPMMIKTGRFGQFIACSGFPECKNTKPILKKIEGVKCPLCGGDMIEKKTKQWRTFYGCTSYPKCNFASWDLPRPEKCPKCGAFMVERKDKETGEKKLMCIICDVKAQENKEQKNSDGSAQ